MTLGQALKWATHTLGLNAIEDNCLEARVLLGHILNLSPAQLYAQPERTLSHKEAKSLQQLVERRLYREPAAYIVKHKEFYGIDFYIDSRVLIPRPETELLVEEALKFAQSCITHLPASQKPFVIADIGTGCGAIAISLALNLPQVKIYATDISSPALEVAQLNCANYHVTEQITILHGNLLDPLPEPVDLLVANLPYIKSAEISNLSPEITNFEPRAALDGGQNGLNKIRQLLKQTEGKIRPRGCLLLEIGEGQYEAVVSIINHYLLQFSSEFLMDLNGTKRVIKIAS